MQRGRRYVTVEEHVYKTRALRAENFHLQGCLEYNVQYIEQLRYDYDRLAKKYNKVQEKKKELEKSHDKTVLNLTHNSRDNIVATLKLDIERLQGERNERDKEIAELKSENETLNNRLSKAVGHKLTDGNPAISDLSNPNRPQKLAEMFSTLYDNEWTNAFEKSEEIGDDRQIASYLLNVFKEVCEFCKETAEEQFSELEKSFMIQKETKDGQPYVPPLECIKALKEARKQLATEMLPELNTKFKTTKMQVKEDIQPYVEGCMELLWFSTITDPPLEYVFDTTDRVEDFRVYTKSGKNVDYVVWPAMYLCKHGAMMSKGVAQFRD